jgi:hypothetical protein
MSAPIFTSKERPKVKAGPDPFKKPKAKFSKGATKGLLGFKGVLPQYAAAWLERWMAQLVQERSLPPQIAGADALGALQQMLAPQDVAEVLARLRREFRVAFPLLFPPPPPPPPTAERPQSPPDHLPLLAELSDSSSDETDDGNPR